MTVDRAPRDRHLNFHETRDNLLASFGDRRPEQVLVRDGLDLAWPPRNRIGD